MHHGIVIQSRKARCHRRQPGPLLLPHGWRHAKPGGADLKFRRHRAGRCDPLRYRLAPARRHHRNPERQKLEQRLRKVQNVLSLTISRVTVSGMSMSIQYRGRQDQFAAGLKDAGFGIYQGSGGRILTEYKAGQQMALGGSSTAPEGADSGSDEEPPVEEPQIIRPQ